MLLREKDRVEYARYVLTGHIFPMGAKEITSSPTFLDPPDSAILYVKAQVESIFCAVDLARQLDFEGSFVSYIEKVFISNLENLRKPIREGQIKITLKVGNISAGNKTVETQEMRQAQVDWSNIPDYLTTHDFFSIARQCSAKGTKHSFHLMN